VTEASKTARKFQDAMQQTAEYIFSGKLKFHKNWSRVKAIFWSEVCAYQAGTTPDGLGNHLF